MTCGFDRKKSKFEGKRLYGHVKVSGIFICLPHAGIRKNKSKKECGEGGSNTRPPDYWIEVDFSLICGLVMVGWLSGEEVFTWRSPN